MGRRILFAVGQEGSFAYLLPLWEFWLASLSSPDWRVFLDVGTYTRRSSDELGRLRCAPVVAESKDALVEALGDWQPDVVVASATGASVEKAMCGHARERGLPVVRFIDTWYGYRDRLQFFGQAFELPDRVLVIDQNAVRDAEADGLPRRLLVAVGHPVWEAVRPLPAANLRDVLFVSQPIRRAYGDRLGYTEYESWALFQDIARRNRELIGRIYFAPHPADDMPPPVDDGVTVVRSGREGIAAVGMLVGMFSSLLVEGFLAGRRIVSLQPGAQGKDMNAWGCLEAPVPRATDRVSFIDAFQKPPADASSLRAALKDSRERLEREIEHAAVSRRCG